MTAIDMTGRVYDLPRLAEELAELAPDGICVVDNFLYHADNDLPHAELPPEAVPIVDAHDGSRPQRTASFAAADDQERLRLINDRARADPAFAALADFVLRGVSR